MHDNIPALSLDSRIFFGIHHPIQHNVKSKHLGEVLQEDMPNLMRHWLTNLHGDNTQGTQFSGDSNG